MGGINFGRSPGNEVRIDDISVSRSHARFCYKESRDQFYLQDLGSKFGSLVQLKRSLEITKSRIKVQSGRSLLRFRVSGVSDHSSLQTQLLPINTGIPLTTPLFIYANDPSCAFNTMYKSQKNLLHKPYKLCLNSSIDEDESEFEVDREVELGDILPMEELSLCQNGN